MSRVLPPSGEAVEVVSRRYMTETEKISRWIECGQRCTVCREPVSWEGLWVVWDHRVALALGGTNDLSNMEPHHALHCASAKTRTDMKAIAKAKRLIRKADLTTRKAPTMKSAGFQKHPTKKRTMSGQVIDR